MLPNLFREICPIFWVNKSILEIKKYKKKHAKLRVFFIFLVDIHCQHQIFFHLSMHHFQNNASYKFLINICIKAFFNVNKSTRK